MIRNIIFDVGQVLVDFRWREYLLELGLAPETVELFGRELIQAPIWSDLDLGVRPEEEVYEEMCQKLPEHREEIRRFLDRPVDIVRPFPGTRSWMSGLKARGYGIYLLSNYPKSLFELHEQESFNFMDLIDGKIVSAFEQLVKPQPEIYELLLSRYGLKAQECVFLDDRTVNLEAAGKLGFHTIHVTSQERAMEELEQMLD
jgi:putative hydrolase of the HAD superfamily